MRTIMPTRLGVLALILVCVFAGDAAAATLKVSTTTDSHGHKCSLRAAITAVDSPGVRTSCGKAGRVSNTIVLRAGHYRLTVKPAGADDNTTGDLNVTRSTRVTISGAGSAATVIDASGLGDRMLSISGGSRVTLSRLKISGGHAPNASVSCGAGGNGGAILNGGSLRLDTVVVAGNTAGDGGPCATGNAGAGGAGGGIYTTGTLALTNSTVRANTAGGGGSGAAGASSVGTGGSGQRGGDGGMGGGIYNRGQLSVIASFIFGNQAGRGGAGGAGGAGTLARGPGGPGGSGGAGGGVFSSLGALGMTNTTLVGNLAGAGGVGGSGGAGGAGGSGGAIAVSAGTARS